MSSLPSDVKNALDQLSEHYEGFEQVDRGANGYLFFAMNKVSKAQIAIKFYAGEKGEARHDEPKQLSAIRSKNVLPILDARNVSDEWGYFATPRCFEGDLDDLIVEQPSAHRAVDVALGICNGVSAIHGMKMLHRDLKPGNIVLLNGSPQIADFGSVRVLAENVSVVSASQHSILYRPPESFESGTYDLKGDLYQIGVVTYQLLGGDLPYDGEEYLNSKQKAQYASLKSAADRSIYVDDTIRAHAVRGSLLDMTSLPAWVNTAAKRAIRRLTSVDPDMRGDTVADVAATLTQLRATLSNWRWHGDVATLATSGRITELRPNDDGSYHAYLSKEGGPFRRAPGLPAAGIDELIRRV